MKLRLTSADLGRGGINKWVRRVRGGTRPLLTKL